MNTRKKPATVGPLDQRHLNVLNKLIELCDETLAYCRVCHECNLDVSPEQKKTEEQLDMAKRIKARFFPTAK